jgi:hypothetical protein
MIKLGSKVRDSISGYEGIATARTNWLNGCVGICIEGPLAKDDKGVVRRDDLWVDEQRVEVLKVDAWKPKGAYANEQERRDPIHPALASAGGPLGSSMPPRDGAR